MARFLQITFGSASELEYHLLLARDLHYISHPDYETAAHEVAGVKRMLTGRTRRVRSGFPTDD
jgi:four helix bundle protein